MEKIKVTISNKSGLHARPASLLTTTASKYNSEIKILKDNKEYNGKSILGILSMGTAYGDKIEIIAEGEDEKVAIENISNLVKNNFGE
ncbi:MAG: HPr family phosphocarrier protein [Firmicutes bacterium]|nr:HPr family phosphocarrier protein [Bacillota bacterium]